jgi:hypothetical protein
MKTKTKLALIIIVIVALVTVGTVSAQQGSTLAEETPAPTLEPDACSGSSISGTVVAVNSETNEVWIWDGTTLCKVTVSEGVTGGNPVATLLGQYFEDMTGEELIAALETNLSEDQVCIVEDTTTTPSTWIFVDDCDATGVQKVIAQNPDGTYVVLIDNGDGTFTTETLTIPDAEAFKTELLTKLTEFQTNLALEEDLDGNGNVLSTIDEIEQLHEEGLGFGVIVKLYSLAQKAQEKCLEQTTSQEPSQSEMPNGVDPCTIDVNYLVEQFMTNHIGLGKLYKTTGLGKPNLLGVGHVRKAAAEMTNGDEDGDTGEGETPTSTKFNGLGRGQGNTSTTPPGLAKKNKDTSTETTVQEPSSSSAHPGKGKGPSKENPGKGNGKGKNKGKP